MTVEHGRTIAGRRAPRNIARESAALTAEGHASIFAEQLRRGFPTLRFAAPLEREFRDFYVAQNLRRTTFSGLIALVVVLAVAGIDRVLGGSDGAHLDTLRVGVLSPLLAALTIAVSLPALRRWYTPIMAVGIGFIGLVVIYISHTAALAGASYVLIDVVVVILYGSLFVGLLFNIAIYLAALMITAHVIAGLWFGLPLLELLHTSAVLGGTAFIGGMSTYNLEHSLRTNFLETGLLNELAERDGMTGLYNRRIFDDHVERLWRHSRRDGTALAIVFADIDFFKIFNDLYGHQAGDDCLKKVADCVARGAHRPLDLAGRYGGEEFMLALYGSSEDYAREIAEQIRHDVLSLAIPHAGSVAARCVTVSVGVAVAGSATARSLAGTIQLADEALYQAKSKGRNSVVFQDVDDSNAETGNFRATLRE
jgi:diguanylate cyclase (GGDEF)-like protein